MKKLSKFSTVITILMLALLFVPGLALIFQVDSPNYSKEPLSPFPEGPIKRETAPEFDNWWSDHFSFRSVLVTGHNKV